MRICSNAYITPMAAAWMIRWQTSEHQVVHLRVWGISIPDKSPAPYRRSRPKWAPTPRTIWMILSSWISPASHRSSEVPQEMVKTSPVNESDYQRKTIPILPVTHQSNPLTHHARLRTPESPPMTLSPSVSEMVSTSNRDRLPPPTLPRFRTTNNRKNPPPGSIHPASLIRFFHYQLRL